MLAVLALSLLASSPGLGPAALDPREVHSPSDSWKLEIEPEDRYGRGAATYRLLTRTEAELEEQTEQAGWSEAWSGTLPYTLRRAAVADDGTWLGFAQAGHLKGVPLLAVIVSPTGEVVMEQVWDQRQWGPDGPGYPQGDDVFLRPARGQCVFMLEEHPNRGELWRVHDLATGHLVEEFRPRDLLDAPHGVDPLFGIAVPDTPLTLLQWYLHDHPRLGARFTLHDPDWVEVWRLELLEDLVVADDMDRGALLRRVWSETSVADVRARGFTVRSYAQDALLDFELEPGQAGQWSVAARGRREVPRPPAAVLGSSLELRALGQTPLRGELQQPAWGSIDHAGRLLVADLATGTVHVFDSTGEELARCHPWPGEDGAERRLVERASAQVVGAPDGSVYRRAGFRTLWQRFARDGTLVEDVDLETRWIGFGARSLRRWQLRDGTLERLSSSGGIELAVSRHTDGTWLRSPSVAVAPDGAPVVLDEGAPGPTALAPWPPAVPARLSFLTPDGRHERTVALPVEAQGELGSSKLVYSREWAALDSGNSLLLVRRSTGTAHPTRLVGHDSSSEEVRTLGFSPDGRQLWCLTSLRLERYALP